MSIKVDQIIADEILPRSSISGRLGTSSNPWDAIYGSFGTFTFPEGDVDFNNYWQENRIYTCASPAMMITHNFIHGPKDVTLDASTLILIVLQYHSSVCGQILITPTATYRRQGTPKGNSWDAWRTDLNSDNYNQWAPAKDGSGANGTWSIDIDGNATSADVAEIADSLTLNSANSRTSYKLLLTDNTGKAYSDMDFQYVNSPIYGRSLSVNDITMKGSLLSEKEILIANNRVKIIGGELKADTLRQSLGLSNALHFIGVAINNITDGGTEDPGITNYQSKTAGDVVLGKDGHEYLWTGNAWEKLGDESSFKLKQSAVATPSSSATGCNAFISDISQNGEGIISPIKKQIAPLTLKNKFNQTLTYDGSSVITFSAAARRCIIGSETTEGLNKWYKFADITVPGRYPDREIVFKVSTGFHDNCKNQQSGILRAHIRCGDVAGKIERTQSNIQWEYANDTINPNNFILVYTDNTEKGEVLVELYVKLTEVYCHYHFNVLQEHDRRNTQTFWNLYSTNANGYENLPEDNQLSVGQDLDLTTLTYLPSVLLTIKNNVISLQNSTTSIADGKATFSGTTLIKGSFQSKNIYPYINSNESISNGNWNLGKKDAIWKGVYCKNLYFLDEENNGTDQESYAYITINSKGVAAAEGAEGAVGVAALKLGNSYPAEDILNADGTVKVAAKNGNAKGRIILYNTKNKCVHLEAPDGLERNPTITFPLLSQTLIGTKGSSEIEGQLTPKATNTYDLGTSQLKWKNIYATTFNGNATTASKLYIHSTSPSTAATYYPTWTTGGSADRDLSVNSGFRIHLLEGTTTTNGHCSLRLGTSTATGSDKNQYGALQLYDTKDKCQELRALAATGDDGASRISYLRDYGKTGYLVATTSTEAKGQEDIPVYVSDKGVITVGSLYAGGTKVTLNGTSKSASEASFYAPTATGTSGQYLKSNGNGAPVWATTTVSNSWIAGKTAGPKLTTTVNGVTSTGVAIPSASADTSGIVTTGAQTFAGAKTFSNNNLKIQGDSDNALTLWSYKTTDGSNMYGFGVYGNEGDVNYLWLSYNATKNLTQFSTPLVLKDNEKAYGTGDPETIITTPTVGQLYFKLID